MKIDLRIEESGSVVTVHLKGALYVEDAAALRMELMDYIKKGCKDFVFDVGDMNYIDSSGLGVLVAIHKRVKDKEGSVTIRNLQGTVKELFFLTRLTKVFVIE